MTLAMDVLLVLAGGPILAAAAYLFGFTLLWRRPVAGGPSTGRLRFAVLIPAHNEQNGIGATVRSLQAADYPPDRRTITVVADNCSDRTAEVAAAHGADVLVRTDDERRGKGQALRFGIERLLTRAGHEWDAMVIVDADTVVEPNLFHALARRFEAGECAVQAAYLPRAGGRQAVSTITYVAFVAFHLVRSMARERLGLSCGLRGNGMAFTRRLLASVPHDAFSRTEDLEFGVQLGMRGIRVAFAGDTRVYGEMPETHRAVQHQRERWIGGRAAIARRFAGGLLRRSFSHRDAAAADLAVDTLVPPVSVLAAVSFAGLVVAGTLSVVSGVWTASATVWAAAFTALSLHVAHAAAISGRGAEFARAALSIPAYAVDKMLTTARVAGRTDETWVRTPRQGELQ